MEKTCTRHLIKCRCVLTQFKRMDNPPSYEFVVFSEIVDGQVQSKLASCPNCGIFHKVIDLCTSQILSTDESKSAISKDDIRQSLSDSMIFLLEKYDVDISLWEYARWIVENQAWGHFLILEQEKIRGGKSVKIASILGESLFRIESKFISDEV